MWCPVLGVTGHSNTGSAFPSACSVTLVGSCGDVAGIYSTPLWSTYLICSLHLDGTIHISGLCFSLPTKSNILLSFHPWFTCVIFDPITYYMVRHSPFSTSHLRAVFCLSFLGSRGFISYPIIYCIVTLLIYTLFTIFSQKP